MQDKHYLIPSHNEGVETDIVHSQTAETVEDAEDFFVAAKDRLLNIAGWDKYSGITRVHFHLADSHKHMVSRNARRGDHILINEAGAEAEDDYDWLTIDALEYDDYPDQSMETFAIRLHLSASETDKTSATIVVGRKSKELTATYHGRNNANLDPALWHGMEDTQWGALMQGLIRI